MKFTPHTNMGIIFFNIQSMESFLSGEIPPSRACHGIRNIRIHHIRGGRDLGGNQSIVFEVSSPDIPAYVAYKKIEGTLYYDLESGLPVLDLVFEEVDDEEED